LHPKTIKAIDQKIGRPICFFLTIFRFITGGFRSRRNRPDSKILFIKLIEQGATVLAYSAIQRAVARVGRENVYFCVFEDNRAILDILKIIPEENIFSIGQSNFFTFLIDILSFLFKARRLNISSTVDMEFFSRASAILAYLSGASNRVGLHRFTSELPYRGNLLTHRVQHNPYLHTSKAYLLLVHALEVDKNDIPLLKVPESALQVEAPKINPSEEELKSVRQLLNEKLGGIKGPIVLLNPNASDMLPLRKWPTDRFMELGNRILAEHSESSIVITGAPSEQDDCQQIAANFNSNRVVSVAGETSLYDLIVLYSIADILVTNDSGPGHFASMTDIKTIVMFGPETPQLFGPLGDNIEVIWKNLACSPCVNAFNHRFSPCNNNVCMQEITVEEVYSKVKELM